MLSGNATFTAAEIDALNRKAATTFYQSAGTLTSAMRKAAESINTVLLERNLSTTGRGQYALGLLALGVIREDKCTLLLSGPTHAIWVGEGQSRQIHDPALSGKGLGSSQSIQTYLAQVDLHTNDLLVLCGKFPKDWEADLLGERPPTSLEATYRKLTFTKGDLNAAILQPQLGQGIITVLRAEVNAPHQTQPMPAPVPQAVTASESNEPHEDVEDILVEPPQSSGGGSLHMLDVNTGVDTVLSNVGIGFFGPRGCFLRVRNGTLRAVSRSQPANSAGVCPAMKSQLLAGTTRSSARNVAAMSVAM